MLSLLRAPRGKKQYLRDTFKELRSASREDSSASFNAVVPKAVEKVVVQVKKDQKPTAVRNSASRSDMCPL